MTGVARGGARVLAARLGVVVCVAIACLAGAGKLDDTVAIFDFRADAHAAETISDRMYPDSPWVAGNAKVLEDSRFWMPEDATYRVIEPRMFAEPEGSGYGRHFLRNLLLPRTQTQSESAPWVFCYSCTPGTLGPGYEVLSDSGDGFLFARRRS